MCGIVGIYRPDGLFDPAQARRDLEGAAGLLRHRGPDAQGVALMAEHGVGFAHRRLSILDLDARADQPMASADGAILLTYNGEVYNFRELRLELEAAGVRFRTESDTEVVIEGYRAWGMELLLGRLAGMFAFALYDAGERVLFLARDRAGKKPLFYAETRGGLAFASELRALFSLGVPRELDPVGLDGYLALKFVPPPRTLVRGVSKLPPACLLEARRGRPPRTARYWSPFARRASPASRDSALDLLDASFEAAVRRRLVSDVPVCLFLSGGIDSSLTAAYLARAGARDMKAYTIGYKDLPGYNEFEWSRMVAGRFGLKSSEIVLESRQVLGLLEGGVPDLDEPLADWVWLPLHALSARAREDGFKVVLVGEGSDELFFGYDVMMEGLSNLKRFSSGPWKLAAKALAAALAPVYRRASRGHRRYDLWRRAAAGEPVYMGSSIGYGKSQRGQVAGPRLLEGGDGGEGCRFIEGLYRDYREGSPRPEDWVSLISYVEFYSKMSEVLLQRVDRVTMRNSIEARSAFLDHELVELAFSIPGAWKAEGGVLKGLLKDLARRTLPAPVVDRKKMGFSFPFKEWLRGELGGLVESAFGRSRLFSEGWLQGDFCRRLLAEHRGGRVDHAPRLWAIFDLCRWHERWM
ncbi:MAG: asparagine synthase (glutamine-hydrolyzing) [Elusimicrobia bacterium]|nr:asparagine synthase (glutamine-hydrolyzing) [Elusimicrobiota bacterium]